MKTKCFQLKSFKLFILLLKFPNNTTSIKITSNFSTNFFVHEGGGGYPEMHAQFDEVVEEVVVGEGVDDGDENYEAGVHVSRLNAALALEEQDQPAQAERG